MLNNSEFEQAGQSIQLFNNPQFGSIRTAGTPDNPQFCLSDVCKILDLSVKGVNQRLDKEVISNYPLPTAGGIQQMNFVNEDGLYDVILDSRKPEAKQFRKWITSEVLPTIRKKGVYATDDFIERSINDPEYGIKMLTALKEERENRRRLEAKVEADQPKVIFADAVATAKKSILVGELAKLLNQNGIRIGQNRLFTWLRDKHYLGERGEYYNIPTQKAMEMGLFEIKKTSVSRPDGSILVSTTTKVTGKGQIYFINKFIKERDNVPVVDCTDVNLNVEG